MKNEMEMNANERDLVRQRRGEDRRKKKSPMAGDGEYLLFSFFFNLIYIFHFRN